MSEYLDKPLRTEEEAMADVVKLHDPLYTDLRAHWKAIEATIEVYVDYEQKGTTAQRQARQIAMLAADNLKIAFEKLV